MEGKPLQVLKNSLTLIPILFIASGLILGSYVLAPISLSFNKNEVVAAESPEPPLEQASSTNNTALESKSTHKKSKPTHKDPGSKLLIPSPELKAKVKKQVWEISQDYPTVPTGKTLELFKFESLLHPEQVNVFPNKYGTSTATGLAMFTIGTWQSECVEKFGLKERKSIKDNATCFFELWSRGEYHHWLADPATRAKIYEIGLLR